VKGEALELKRAPGGREQLWRESCSKEVARTPPHPYPTHTNTNTHTHTHTHTPPNHPRRACAR